MIYTTTKIWEMAQGDEDFVNSVISVFLEEIPADLKALELAIANQDHDSIYTFAHKIKPNVDLMGMETTAQNALQLERMGKKQVDVANMSIYFSALKKDILQAINELQNDFQLQ